MNVFISIKKATNSIKSTLTMHIKAGKKRIIIERDGCEGKKEFDIGEKQFLSRMSSTQYDGTGAWSNYIHPLTFLYR